MELYNTLQCLGVKLKQYLLVKNTKGKQRTAAEQATENAITVFNLETDEIKGQIIGREGRNIRAIEAAMVLMKKLN